MPMYDVVAGVDSETINELVSLVYRELYSESKLMTNSLEVGKNEWDVERFDYDIVAPPVVILSPPDDAREREAGSRSAGTASFTVHFRRVMLNIVVASQGDVSVMVAVTAVLTVSGGAEKGVLRMHADRVWIDVPDESKSTQLLAVLNKLIAPRFRAWLNSLIEPIAVPPLQVPSMAQSSVVTLGQPLPVTQSSHLLAFSALEVTPPGAPRPSAWPERAVFFGAASNVLLRIGNAVLPSGVTSGFTWGMIGGSYHLAFGPIAEVRLDADATASIRIRVRVSADLTVRVPWTLSRMPWPLRKFIPFKLTAIIDLRTVARAGVVGDKLVATLNRFDDFNLELQSTRIPRSIIRLLDPLGLTKALNDSIENALNATLYGLTFEVLRLPTIPVKIAGGRYQITFKDVRTRCAPGLDRDMILFATGSPVFSAVGSTV